MASFADLPHQHALDNLSLDLRWQRALDLDRAEAGRRCAGTGRLTGPWGVALTAGH
jgi:hypothetical protein